MSQWTRLKRLEAKARQRWPAPEVRPANLDEEDWLELFASLGAEGCFTPEPDFPTALELYRDALRRAKAQRDPPFDPPEDFQSNLADVPYLRLLNWRNATRFPEVCESLSWLLEMLHRRQEEIPAVSAAEFEELAAWFRQNEDRLRQLSAPSEFLDVGAGRTTTVANVRHGLHQGVRASEAGELAEDLRRLRARLGER